ncbi:MAG TPA: serine hydrolase domain-containing protein [Nocardioidaceae bacterium]|nr:serine hydrolase domain-containing protein [Nocardioidaceae bacterium]
MPDLEADLTALATEKLFSGAVRVDRAGETQVAAAFGLAERGFAVPNTLDTRFGLASAAKGFTALTVAALVRQGVLEVGTPVRAFLGDDLPEVDDRVTVEHLLAHRSGIGDYLDEDADLDIADYVMPVPVHELSTTEGYLAVLASHPQKFPPGDRFSYCNSGYVVLALVAERSARTPFHDLVRELVLEPAGMSSTGFLRSDELPGGTARGYLGLEGLRTNVLHLPVRGSGDGGIYSTLGDVHAFWRALLDGRILPLETVEDILRPRSDVPEERRRYGLGFWLHGTRDAVMLEGYDAGVSFRSVHDRPTSSTFTVVSNTSEGAWPLVRYLGETLLG